MKGALITTSVNIYEEDIQKLDAEASRLFGKIKPKGARSLMLREVIEFYFENKKIPKK